jgi:hypothetical protein
MGELIMALEALAALEAVAPDLIKVFNALVALFHSGGTKEQAAETLNDVLAAAREACQNVAALNFGTGDPVSEGLAKFNEAQASLQSRYEAIGQPLTDTQAKTAVQTAYVAIKTGA